MLPLAIAMCLNVVLMNISLTISSITFYQIARILITPFVALINYFFYRKSIPRQAAFALIPMCLGVAIISYYENQSNAESLQAIGLLSVILAVGSVFVSAVYTVWIATYQRQYEINGFQLLFNQAPIGAVLLLFVAPLTDTMPTIETTSSTKWILVGFSGLLAAIINLSQFFIISGAGPVSSTVIGHLKTCSIVMLGWAFSSKAVTDRSVFGVLLAMASVGTYSAIMIKANAKA